MSVSQAERRARSRAALLESAARGLSRYGYGNLALERVAADAGYSRGALYHQFADKEELALAVVDWVQETWSKEVGAPAALVTEPIAALVSLARGHAAFCRRDIARVMTTLRLEFAGRDHPVGRAVSEAYERLHRICGALISAGRADGSIPPGPPVRVLAKGYVGAIEGAVIQVSGQAPHDEILAERIVVGLLVPNDDAVVSPTTRSAGNLPGDVPTGPTPTAFDIVTELHRRQSAMYAGGDEEPVRELLADDVVWHVPGASAIAGDHRGVGAVMRYFARRRDLTADSLMLEPGLALTDENTVAQFVDGSAVISHELRRWQTIGIYRVTEDLIREVWLIPLDLDAFDRVWAKPPA